MQVKVEKQPKSTLKLIISVPAVNVKEEYEKVFEEVVKNAEFPGFRKGMAPKNMVKQKTDVSKLYGEVINNLLQKYYSQTLKENLIQPVSNPRVEIKEFDPEKDFEFTAILAIRPEVEIGEFRLEIKSNYEKKIEGAKKQNEEKLKKGEPISDIHVHLNTNDIIDGLLKNSKVEVSDLLIDEETERMMSRLVDQAQSIGLSLDQYLKAQNKTADQLKDEYKKVAENNIKSEFILDKLIKDEKVEVTDKEVEDMIKASGVPDAKEKLNNTTEKWYIKNILEKNKLITKLMEEAEGENHHAR